MKRRLFIAMATYSGTAMPETQRSLQAAIEGLGSKYDYDFAAISGNCYIDTTRNMLAQKFLASKADDMVFVDDDVGFPRDALTRLRDFSPEIVAGIYPKKCEPLQWPVDLAPTPEVHPEGLIQCLVIPTGLMRIRREVFETLADKVPSYSVAGSPMMRAYFKTDIRGGKYWGEDVEFCRLWHEAGGKLWGVANMPMRHVDKNGRVFQGNWGPSLLSDIKAKLAEAA